MNTILQWDIWKHPAEGRDHWYVIISGNERLAKAHQLNGLFCTTLRGQPSKVDVVLDNSDGFDHATVCQCDLFYPIKRTELYKKIGTVSHFRRQAIMRKIIEVFRFIPS